MFLFMLGTGRCGSSFIHEVLTRHPHIGFVSNLEDVGSRLGLDLLGRYHGWAYRRIPPSVAQRIRPRYVPSEAYRLLDRRVSPVLSETVRDLRADDATPWLAVRTRRFFDVRRAAQATPVFAHKFTGWPRAGFLAQVFPEARFVHIVRDGRAVANSFLQMSWWRGYEGPTAWQLGELPEHYRNEWERSGRSYVLLAGLAWKILVDAHDAAEKALGPSRWLTLRYEDVVADPRAQVGTLLRFAGLEWTPAFEHEFTRHEFRSGRVEAFRRDLDPANLALLEASLTDHLRRHGYRPTGDGRRGEAAAST